MIYYIRNPRFILESPKLKFGLLTLYIIMNLTIVYSTRKKEEKFVRHLQQSCGLKNLEILVYQNDNKKSLSEVYNQGITKASNDIVVFTHDDVIFENKNWGAKILLHFQHSVVNFGILGVAGTTHLPKSGVWWQDKSKKIGIIKHQQHGKTWTSKYSGNFKDRIIPVVCVDGVFMAVNRKKLQENFNFNETFKGFHFYDVDFCLNNHLAGVKIGVIFNVPIIHKSLGQTNKAWERNRVQFISSHKYNLPCTIKGDIIVENNAIKLKRYPKVSVIILHNSQNFLLFNCLNSFVEKSNYPNYEVIVADTGLSKPELDEIYEFVNLSTLNIKVVKFNHSHFARVTNEIVFNHSDTSTDLLLFCNNNIELINDAVTRMVRVYTPKNCGTIGCRLHFANNEIQHAGIQLMMNQGKLEISHKGLRSYYNFYTGGVEKNVIGATAAFLLMSRVLFKKIGGFNTAYTGDLEDIELNLTCIKYNKINYFVGDAVCYQLGSQTRLDKVARDDYNNLVNFLQENPNIVRKYVPNRENQN